MFSLIFCRFYGSRVLQPFIRKIRILTFKAYQINILKIFVLKAFNNFRTSFLMESIHYVEFT